MRRALAEEQCRDEEDIGDNEAGDEFDYPPEPCEGPETTAGTTATATRTDFAKKFSRREKHVFNAGQYFCMLLPTCCILHSA